MSYIKTVDTMKDYRLLMEMKGKHCYSRHFLQVARHEIR